VKNKHLTNSLLAAVLLASPLVNADSKYPAADFQPEIVYQDNDLIAKEGKAEAASVAAKPAAKAVEATAVDSKYPAADFQPQVIYHDDSYKPSETVKATAAKATEEKVAQKLETETADVAVTSETAKKEDTSLNYILGLVGLIAVGGFLFKKQGGCGSAKKVATNTSVVSAATKIANTGVARYLNKVSGTGVSRYLEQKVKTSTPVTGVAKYVAKQVVAAKTTAAQTKTTGVEKYMRDRG